jgi:hypothetical protein
LNPRGDGPRYGVWTAFFAPNAFFTKKEGQTPVDNVLLFFVHQLHLKLRPLDHVLQFVQTTTAHMEVFRKMLLKIAGHFKHREDRVTAKEYLKACTDLFPSTNGQ